MVKNCDDDQTCVNYNLQTPLDYKSSLMPLIMPQEFNICGKFSSSHGSNRFQEISKCLLKLMQRVNIEKQGKVQYSSVYILTYLVCRVEIVMPKLWCSASLQRFLYLTNLTR